MSIEQRLADIERRLATIEGRLGPTEMRQLPWSPHVVGPPPQVCSCKPGEACMNAACPMRPQIMCGGSD